MFGVASSHSLQVAVRHVDEEEQLGSYRRRKKKRHQHQLRPLTRLLHIYIISVMFWLIGRKIIGNPLNA